MIREISVTESFGDIVAVVRQQHKPDLQLLDSTETCYTRSLWLAVSRRLRGGSGDKQNAHNKHDIFSLAWDSGGAERRGEEGRRTGPFGARGE